MADVARSARFILSMDSVKITHQKILTGSSASVDLWADLMAVSRGRHWTRDWTSSFTLILFRALQPLAAFIPNMSKIKTDLSGNDGSRPSRGPSIKSDGHDPVPDIKKSPLFLWGDPTQQWLCTWPLFRRIGQV